MPRRKRTELTEKQEQFLEWLLTHPIERVPATQRDLAQVLDVHERTLRGWKTDALFLAEWNERVDGMILGGPENMGNILNNMYSIAGGAHAKASPGEQVRAAETILRLQGRMKPPTTKVEITGGSEFEDMPDEEIAAMIAADAAGPSLDDFRL